MFNLERVCPPARWLLEQPTPRAVTEDTVQVSSVLYSHAIVAEHVWRPEQEYV